MNLNVLKLWKTLLKLAEIDTDKAKLIVESEIAEGVEVFVEKDGEYAPAEDGEYETEDKVIVVADGKIAEIREKEVEQEPEQEPESKQEPESEQEPEQEPAADERDARIAELEAIIVERDARIAELEALIAEKDAELAKKQAQLEMSADEPAKDKVKKEVKNGALKYFN